MTLSSHEALVIGSAFMRDTGMLFPAGLALTGGQLEFRFVLREGQLSRHRTRGPYTPEQPPVDVIQWVQLRHDLTMAGRMPEFFVDAGGQWARITVELPGTGVRALIVVPEELTAEAIGAPFLGQWQDQMPSQVKITLDGVARTLAHCHHRAGGPEPLIDLNLTYRQDPDYEQTAANIDMRFREHIAPVIPVLRLSWRSATDAQRSAFLDSLDGVRNVGNWPRRRLITRSLGAELELPSS